MNWIDVNHKLPKIGSFVLWTDGHTVSTTTYVARTGFIASAYVTHWMPLPKPPTQDKG